MFTQLLSIFIIIASGYGAKKFKVFEQKNASVFINYALCFALPALIFDKIYQIYRHRSCFGGSRLLLLR